MEENQKVFQCNMELTLDLIGGKWKPIIIFHIGNEGVLRYGELKRLIPAIHERVLSRELKLLEEHNLIQKKTFHEKILRVEYRLTPYGKEVLPILNMLSQWGSNYNKQFHYAKVICSDHPVSIDKNVHN